MAIKLDVQGTLANSVNKLELRFSKFLTEEADMHLEFYQHDLDVLGSIRGRLGLPIHKMAAIIKSIPNQQIT